MLQLVKHACGDTQVISLLSSSPLARDDILQRLQRSSCPACQRRSRYEDAHGRAELAGLHPLRAAYSEQLALAEVIRATLWDLLLPRDADEQSSQLLAALFNRRLHASFWLSLRSWTMYKLTSEQVGHLLLNLLQPQDWGKAVQFTREELI